MDVLEDHNGGLAAFGQLMKRHLEDTVASAFLEESRDFTPELSRDVHQWAQRPGRGERVACAPHRCAALGDRIAELAAKGGLAAAGLAGNQYQPTGAFGC